MVYLTPDYRDFLGHGNVQKKIMKITETIYPIQNGDTVGKQIYSEVHLDEYGKVISDFFYPMECHSGFIRKVQVIYNDQEEIEEYCFFDNNVKGDCWKPGEIPATYGGCGLLGEERPALKQRLDPKNLLGTKYMFI